MTEESRARSVGAVYRSGLAAVLRHLHERALWVLRPIYSLRGLRWLVLRRQYSRLLLGDHNVRFDMVRA